MDFDCHPCRSLGCSCRVLLGTSLNANVLEEQPTYLRRDDEVNDGFNGSKAFTKAFEPNDGSNEGTITSFFKEVIGGKATFGGLFLFDYATRGDVYDAKD